MAIGATTYGSRGRASNTRPASLDLRMGAALLEVSRQPVVLLDREGRIHGANEAFRHTVGLDVRALVGRKLSALVEMEGPGPGDRAGTDGSLQRVRVSKGDGRKVELLMRWGRAGGEAAGLHFAWFSRWDGATNDSARIAKAEDEAARALVAFREHLGERIGAAQRERMSLLVLLIELVDVQALGARLGRAGSREVLRTAVRRMKTSIEGVGSVARLPGGRFAVVAPVNGPAPMARRVANIIAYNVRRTYTVGSHAIDVRVITGQAVSPSDGSDAKSLLGTAEVELVAAREAAASTH